MDCGRGTEGDLCAPPEVICVLPQGMLFLASCDLVFGIYKRRDAKILPSLVGVVGGRRGICVRLLR